MPVTPLFVDESGRKQTTVVVREFDEGGSRFQFTYITEPHNRSPLPIKTMIHNILDGKCLGITAADVTTNISRSNYSVVAELKNLTDPCGDSAICTLQYASWCAGQARPQLWMNDVCRVPPLPRERRPAVSPTRILIREMEALARERGIDRLWLFVSKENPTEMETLIRIYTNYGFQVATEDVCALTDAAVADLLVMWKPLVAAAGGAGASAPMNMTGGRQHRRNHWASTKRCRGARARQSARSRK